MAHRLISFAGGPGAEVKLPTQADSYLRSRLLGRAPAQPKREPATDDWDATNRGPSELNASTFQLGSFLGT